MFDVKLILNGIKFLIPLLVPFFEKLVDIGVPSTKLFAYDNAVKGVAFAFEGLERLRIKVKTTPNEIDNKAFNASLEVMEALGKYILDKVESLRV
jgi:hypothetical protein